MKISRFYSESKLKMKVWIIFPFTPGPSGGGNSFLTALRDYFIKKGVYSNSLKEADLVLFNSHHSFWHILWAKISNSRALFIHRIDGPMSLYNQSSDIRDKVVRILSNNLADGTIFQSDWCKGKHIELKLWRSMPSAVIWNAPYPEIFDGTYSKIPLKSKFKIIASSWSSNENKGRKTFDYLEQNLDFNRYSLTLVGNQGGNYQNIKTLPPLSRQDLKNAYLDSHLYLFPSRFEACSNALLEALHLGIPTLAFKGSSNTEIVQCEKNLFLDESELLAKIESLRRDYEDLQSPALPSLAEVGERYYKFFLDLKDTKPKGLRGVFKAVILILIVRLRGRLERVF